MAAGIMIQANDETLDQSMQTITPIMPFDTLA